MHKLLTDRYETIPWDDLDNIVYDVGNVLISFHPTRMLDILFPGERELHERLMRKVFLSPYWVTLDRGDVPLDEVERAMIGQDQDIAEEIHHTLMTWSELPPALPEGVLSMRIARSHGKKLFLLSNYNDIFFSRAQERFEFLNEPCVDGMAISSRVGFMKPDIAIFNHLAHTYHLDPSRTVFIDDSPVNVEAAMQAGWEGIWRASADTLPVFMDFRLGASYDRPEP